MFGVTRNVGLSDLYGIVVYNPSFSGLIQ